MTPKQKQAAADFFEQYPGVNELTVSEDGDCFIGSNQRFAPKMSVKVLRRQLAATHAPELEADEDEADEVLADDEADEIPFGLPALDALNAAEPDADEAAEDPQPEPKTLPDPQPEPETKTAPASQPEPETKTAPEPKPEREHKPEEKTDPQPRGRSRRR